MKRKFNSHVCCEKDTGIKEKRKKKHNVENLVSNCYVNVAREMVESESKTRCNGCVCSFAEKMELFFTTVMVKLMSNNDEVLKRFDSAVEANVAVYNKDDVENARKMLRCGVHRNNFCKGNQLFFKDTILKMF